MLVTPASFRTPMAKFRQVAMARGALPLRSWEASSAKVVSRTWCGASIFQWSRMRFELGGRGFLGGQAGDGVDGLDGGPAGFAVGAASLDLDRLAGSGEEQVLDGGGLNAADFSASDAPGAALERDVPPGHGLELLAQVLLVTLNDHDAVGLAPQEILGVLALGAQCVAGDDCSGQFSDAVQQRLEAGDFVGLLANVQLGQDQAGGVLDRGEQVNLSALCLACAAQALAVDRQAARCGGVGWAAVRQPTADSPVQRVAVDAGQQPTDCRLCGQAPAWKDRIATCAELFQQVGRYTGDPLSDRQE